MDVTEILETIDDAALAVEVSIEDIEVALYLNDFDGPPYVIEGQENEVEEDSASDDDDEFDHELGRSRERIEDAIARLKATLNALIAARPQMAEEE